MAKCSTSSARAGATHAAAKSNAVPEIRPALITLASSLVEFMVHLARRTRRFTRLHGGARTCPQKMLECRARVAAAPNFSGIIGGPTDRGGGPGVSGRVEVLCAGWPGGGRGRGPREGGPLGGPPQTARRCARPPPAPPPGP